MNVCKSCRKSGVDVVRANFGHRNYPTMATLPNLTVYHTACAGDLHPTWGRVSRGLCVQEQHLPLPTRCHQQLRPRPGTLPYPPLSYPTLHHHYPTLPLPYPSLPYPSLTLPYTTTSISTKYKKQEFIMRGK